MPTHNFLWGHTNTDSSCWCEHTAALLFSGRLSFIFWQYLASAPENHLGCECNQEMLWVILSALSTKAVVVSVIIQIRRGTQLFPCASWNGIIQVRSGFHIINSVPPWTVGTVHTNNITQSNCRVLLFGVSMCLLHIGNAAIILLRVSEDLISADRIQ